MLVADERMPATREVTPIGNLDAVALVRDRVHRVSHSAVPDSYEDHRPWAGESVLLVLGKHLQCRLAGVGLRAVQLSQPPRRAKWQQ